MKHGVTMNYPNQMGRQDGRRGSRLPTRREVLRWAGTVSLGAMVEWSGLPALAAGAAKATLRAAAARIGVRYGSDSDVQFDEAPKAYASLFTGQCELYAPNLSWAYVTPNRGTTDPASEEPNVAFAHKHGLKLTGFHLLWHERTPRWVKQLQSAEEMRKVIADHVAAMGLHYGDRVYSWNVVNEALNPREGRPHGLRRVPVFEKLGIGVFDHVFRAAAIALPKALRVYNDSGLEMDNREHEAKRQALLRLIDEFKRNGTPIDAVGLESHLFLDGSKFNAKVYRQFLREIAARGLKILITEMDVCDRDVQGDIAAPTAPWRRCMGVSCRWRWMNRPWWPWLAGD